VISCLSDAHLNSRLATFVTVENAILLPKDTVHKERPDLDTPSSRDNLHCTPSWIRREESISSSSRTRSSIIISWKPLFNCNCGCPSVMEHDTRIIPAHHCLVVRTFMVLLPQAERVKENVRHNMPSVFPCSQTAGDNVPYFGASQQAPVCAPVSSPIYHVS
jgi:hypothetical protein